MQPHFQNQNFLTNPSRYFSKISKPLFWRGCMPWVVVSSCKSYFILKAYRTYIHYITQRKLSFKSKLTNYLKQIPLNTQRFTAFLQVGATLFRKFLNFTIHFEQSFNFMFHCSNRCWIYVTIYPLQWYNNGIFIEIIYFFTSVLGSLVIKREIASQFLGRTPGIVWSNSNFMHGEHCAFSSSFRFEVVPTWSLHFINTVLWGFYFDFDVGVDTLNWDLSHTLLLLSLKCLCPFPHKILHDWFQLISLCY